MQLANNSASYATLFPEIKPKYTAIIGFSTEIDRKAVFRVSLIVCFREKLAVNKTNDMTANDATASERLKTPETGKRMQNEIWL
jgi:hypothetical protein